MSAHCPTTVVPFDGIVVRNHTFALSSHSLMYVGKELGELLGTAEGCKLAVGDALGDVLGDALGIFVGMSLGVGVGAPVTAKPQPEYVGHSFPQVSYIISPR